MIRLNNRDKINKPKIRVGRGIGSGKGKTSGRGVKGQKSRSGVSIKSFEGGQMPLYRRLPKRGFNPVKKTKLAKINLEKLVTLINNKKIIGDKISLDLLQKQKIVSKIYLKLKILGNGEVTSKLEIEAHYASKSAIEKVEKAGGTITLIKK